MRALVKHALGHPPRIEQRPDPVPGPGEALVAVRAVGICGTDLHILDDGYPHAVPLIPGHEFAGELLRIEPNGVAEELRPGDRVVGELHVGACRRCETCRAGNPHICPHKRALGTWSDGAFAELLRIPTWLLRRIPPGISDAQATLIEPTACAWHGIFERSQLQRGDRVLVVGHGPIGLLAAHLARAGGARQTIVVGRSGRGGERLRCARALGFEVLDAATVDVQRRVEELTDGHGVDLAVETAGTGESLANCVRCCRRGGRVTVLGVSSRSCVPFGWHDALLRELTVAFAFSSRASSWEGALGLGAAGSLPASELITDVLALDRWREGLAAIHAGDAVKVVLTP